MASVESFIRDEWVHSEKNSCGVFHAVTGEELAFVSSDGVDFRGAIEHARSIGGPALRKLTFHERARMLKQLALYLSDRKEELYEASKPTGATRNDSWIDIEGGIGTFFVYASKGRRELPNEPFQIDGNPERISKNNTFAGQHVCVPLEGVAVHINAFNFPCWGALEKLAPTFLAGMAAIVKPATASCYLTEKLVRVIVDSKILPTGALQLVCGSLGDTLEHLRCQDVVTFTGSKSTGVKLRNTPNLLEHAVRFNMESDSLNCAVLGVDAAPGTAEFELYVKELVREMMVKAGQKCTVIRRAIVPRAFESAVIEAVSKRLEQIVVGDPAMKEVSMGPLINRDQVRDVRAQVEKLLESCEIASGKLDDFAVTGGIRERGAFFSPLLLRCRRPLESEAAHSVEAFGPVSTLLAYDSNEEAIELARLGAGSLVGSIFTANENVARELTLGLAPFHGRLMLMNASCAKESTGHGSPLPHLVHGGPGRAGGGEELGGIRSVFHYMQRVALQGSPERLSQITNRWSNGADLKSGGAHPFRKYFEELSIGEGLVTAEREITEADVMKFAALSGDHFYVHTDDSAAAASIFGKRVAHGYFVLSAAAGLFVDPAPGPVIANYGLEELRFTKPVFFGDRIKVRLACKQKSPKDDLQGVVSWDVEVTNQDGEPVAVYVLLTLVKRLAAK